MATSSTDKQMAAGLASLGSKETSGLKDLNDYKWFGTTVKFVCSSSSLLDSEILIKIGRELGVAHDYGGNALAITFGPSVSPYEIADLVTFLADMALKNGMRQLQLIEARGSEAALVCAVLIGRGLEVDYSKCEQLEENFKTQLNIQKRNSMYFNNYAAKFKNKLEQDAKPASPQMTNKQSGGDDGDDDLFF